jgi:hypothetical protein
MEKLAKNSSYKLYCQPHFAISSMQPVDQGSKATQRKIYKQSSAVLEGRQDKVDNTRGHRAFNNTINCNIQPISMRQQPIRKSGQKNLQTAGKMFSIQRYGFQL